MKRYQEKTVKQFLVYLESMGLGVYGPHMVGDTDYPGCMDYSADEIVKRRKLVDKDKLYEHCDNQDD